jgi:outer membrane lipoprotein-sorting protein
MKKLVAALLASAVMMVPMLSYAQSSRADVDEQVVQAVQDASSYGASAEGSVQSGWATQPSAQALGQALYRHH